MSPVTFFNIQTDSDTQQIGKISGSVDTTLVPGPKGVKHHIEEVKAVAIERCVAAGGNRRTIEVVEVDYVPVSYVMNGATRVMVRVVGDLVEGYEETHDDPEQLLDSESFQKSDLTSIINGVENIEVLSKGSSYDIVDHIDIESYRPRIEGDLWYLSELDLKFLLDGAGVLGVGSCGEPYPSYLACLLALRNGESLTVRRQDTLPDEAVILVAGFMGSPSVYQERIPGVTEVTSAMRGVMTATGINDFDAVIPNEIGGLNAFEALLAGHRFGKSTLDTDLVARAYPMVWQTVRCLDDIPVAPSAVADGTGKQMIFATSPDNYETEKLMRDACQDLGSLSGMCVNPVYGKEAKTLPANSFSHGVFPLPIFPSSTMLTYFTIAWSIGRSIHLSRFLKRDPVQPLLDTENGILLFTGKIISVTRSVSEGFTRGYVLLSPIFDSENTNISNEANEELHVEFENENLCAKLLTPGAEEKVLASCPDLITFLDMANGAPLGIDDYKYGLRVSVIALRSPPIWTSKRGLEMGGPRAFELDMDYKAVSAETGEYEKPMSVWEMFP